MNQNIHFQIFITTRNRPDFLLKSVNSIICQNYSDFEIIVSDNSTDIKTKELFNKLKNPKLKYIKRIPCSANEHFNLILKEASADYFMMFHDDDIMMPNMLKTYNEYIFKYSNQDILAISSNAYLIKKNKKTKILFKKKQNSNILVKDQNHFVELLLNKKSINPFPGYIYNLKIKKKEIVFKGNLCGKYADIAMLIDIASVGEILNIDEALMYYRTHDNNDSKINDFKNRNKLIQYIINKTTFTMKDNLIIRYRLYNIYNELTTIYYRAEKSRLIPYKKTVKLLKLFVHYKTYEYFFKLLALQSYYLIKLKK